MVNPFYSQVAAWGRIHHYQQASGWPDVSHYIVLFVISIQMWFSGCQSIVPKENGCSSPYICNFWWLVCSHYGTVPWPNGSCRQGPFSHLTTWMLGPIGIMTLLDCHAQLLWSFKIRLKSRPKLLLYTSKDIAKHDGFMYTIPETNIAPENGTLEDYFPFGMASWQVLC